MKTKKVAKPVVSTGTSAEAGIVLASVQAEAKPLEKKLKLVKKVTKQNIDEVTGYVKQLKGYAKIAADKEKSMTGPLEKLKKDVIALFKPFRAQVAMEENRIKLLVLDYYAATEKEQAKLQLAISTGKIKKIETYTKKSKDAQFSSSNSSLRKTWRARITDIKKVPREFMCEDMDAIEEHLKSGGKEIPGVVWEQVATVAI